MSAAASGARRSTLSAETRRLLRQRLAFLYGDDVDGVHGRLCALLEAFAAAPAPRHVGRGRRRRSERDAVLITYADGVRAAGERPLATLRRLLETHLRDTVSTVHLLPFYPSSSDDGFSVIDPLAVDGAVGTWDDVEALADGHDLMLDAVVNHMSVESDWFRAFLRDEAPYRDYFVTADPGADLSRVVRPRTSPLLTPFETAAGTRHVWTTFSADQVDLDYANPDVLLEIVRIVLAYAARGAAILRLDAVTYLWKEAGTTCAHHPRTHGVVRLIRSVVDAVAPHVALLTETNVPHHENVAYFGDGHDEAAMVYNFALPPLVLHTFATGGDEALRAWAASLATPSRETSFFNFLASHDGVGLRPVEGLLSTAEIESLAARVEAHDGLLSYGSDARGHRSPYELNVSYFDALSDPGALEPLALQVDRFACAHAIMLALAGVPGVYLHSLLGSRSDHAGVRASGRNRAINRERLALSALDAELGNPRSLRSMVLTRLRTLLRARRSAPAFDPAAPQEVLPTRAGVFALRRGAAADALTCLHNITPATASVDLARLGLAGRDLTDLASGGRLRAGRDLALRPYAVAWLRAAGPRRRSPARRRPGAAGEL